MLYFVEQLNINIVTHAHTHTHTHTGVVGEKTITHEWGHNFGLHHSKFRDVEYGDSASSMGGYPGMFVEETSARKRGGER